MKKKLTDIIRVDSSLSTPIYRQIVQSVCDGIEKGRLSRNDMLPSVNSIAEQFSLARGSVFAAYNDLRSCGIIDSIPGKGYFIASTTLNQKKHIFLQFDALNERTASLYNAICRHMGEPNKVDMYFHRNNVKHFEGQIKNDAVHYNTFVVTPVINADVSPTLSKLPPKHLFILDTGYKEYRKEFIGVYRNPEKELSQLFHHFNSELSKYKRLFLLIPRSDGDGAVANAFKKLAKNTGLPFELQNLASQAIKKGDAFIIYDDNCLVAVVKACRQASLRIGKDVGIISYSEHILKDGVADGITTFSTDLEAMGKTMAQMINAGGHASVEAPVNIIDRHSF